LPNNIKVNGIQTGTETVTKEHFEYSGWGLLRIPKIPLGNTLKRDRVYTLAVICSYTMFSFV
jgi:hypothetical protein